jgi:anti-anti-sigma regulatory factor
MEKTVQMSKPRGCYVQVKSPLGRQKRRWDNEKIRRRTPPSWFLAANNDLAYREQLRAAFDSVSDVPRLVLDFSDVTYIDSTIIAEMVRLHNTRAASGFEHTTVVLDNANIERVFDVLSLAAVFNIVKALDDAFGRDGKPISVQYAYAFDA